MIRQETLRVPLWHRRACKYVRDRTLSKSSETLSLDVIFPSGRRAISCVLAHLGLGRGDRVAVPEWSSHCVLSAVSRIATPIPWKEVLDYGIDVSCGLIYEQWGWPFAVDKLERFINNSNVPSFVIDRVDTATLRRSSLGKACYEVWSLSKVLGLEMGALVRAPDGDWLKCFGNDQNDGVVSCDLINSFVEGSSVDRADVLKSYCNRVASSVVRLLRMINLEKVIEAEGAARRARAEYLAYTLGHTELAVRLLDGGAPGIYPFGLSLSNKDLVRLQGCISELNIESQIYNFNISNDPSKPSYRKCLALPIHSSISMRQIQSVAKLLS